MCRPTPCAAPLHSRGCRAWYYATEIISVKHETSVHCDWLFKHFLHCDWLFKHFLHCDWFTTHSFGTILFAPCRNYYTGCSINSILFEMPTIPPFFELQSQIWAHFDYFWTPALATGSYEITSVRSLVTNFSQNWLIRYF